MDGRERFYEAHAGAERQNDLKDDMRRRGTARRAGSGHTHQQGRASNADSGDLTRTSSTHEEGIKMDRRKRNYAARAIAKRQEDALTDNRSRRGTARRAGWEHTHQRGV